MQCNIQKDDFYTVTDLLLMRKTYKGMHFNVRTSIQILNKKSTFIKNTEYTGILKADKLVYHTRFKMIEIANCWNIIHQYIFFWNFMCPWPVFFSFLLKYILYKNNIITILLDNII